MDDFIFKHYTDHIIIILKDDIISMEYLLRAKVNDLFIDFGWTCENRTQVHFYCMS